MVNDIDCAENDVRICDPENVLGRRSSWASEMPEGSDVDEREIGVAEQHPWAVDGLF